MANNSYLRSTRRERDLVKWYRARGWDACRSAGSHSPWDVWAYDPKTGNVVLTQIKTKKGGRKCYMKLLVRWTNSKVETFWYEYK